MKKGYYEYKVGDESPSGGGINSILRQNDDVIIYTTIEGAGFNWAYKEKGKLSTKALQKYNHINEKIPIELTTVVLNHFETTLTNCLFHALQADTEEEINEIYSLANERISKLISPNKAKVIYVSCSVLFTIIFIGMSFIFHNIIKYDYIFLCIAGGSFGSLFSLLQRNQDIKLSLLEGYFYITVQSLFGALLGCMSGFVMYLLINSGFVFDFAKSNSSYILLFAILSGFSERLIPQLFNKLEIEK